MWMGDSTAERVQRGTIGERCGRGCDDVPTVKRGGRTGRNWQRDKSCPLREEGQETVVRSNETVAGAVRGQDGTLGADARIHDRKVHGTLREVSPGATQQVLPRANVARWNLMTDVDDGHVRQA